MICAPGQVLSSCLPSLCRDGRGGLYLSGAGSLTQIPPNQIDSRFVLCGRFSTSWCWIGGLWGTWYSWAANEVWVITPWNRCLRGRKSGQTRELGCCGPEGPIPVPDGTGPWAWISQWLWEQNTVTPNKWARARPPPKDCRVDWNTWYICSEGGHGCNSDSRCVAWRTIRLRPICSWHRRRKPLRSWPLLGSGLAGESEGGGWSRCWSCCKLPESLDVPGEPESEAWIDAPGVV